MPLVNKLTAKVLIQVGDQDPIEIGEVEIPINVTVDTIRTSIHRGNMDLRA